MQLDWDVIILGAGIAGVSAAKAIREAAFDGAVLLINGEALAPYKRTKLSKHLASGFRQDEFQLQPPEWYQAHRIHRLDDQRVEQIDPAAKTVTLASGACLRWGKFILATGATPCYPPEISPEMPHTYVMRQMRDAERLMQMMRNPNIQDTLVVGIGVLGVEIAEQLRCAGKRVTLAGRSATIMPRQLNLHAATLMKQACEQAGITLLFNEEIATVAPHGEGLTVTLHHETRQTDTIIYCVGTVPNAVLARQAGLAVNVGILTNEYLQTSCPDIFAAGDVVELPGGEIGGLWHSAEAQGFHAGKNAVGSLTPYPRLPFRLKCEVFGQYFFSMLPQDIAHCQIEEYQHDRQYQCFYYRDDQLCGAIMINDGERAKLYERATRENWTQKRVVETLA